MGRYSAQDVLSAFKNAIYHCEDTGGDYKEVKARYSRLFPRFDFGKMYAVLPIRDEQGTEYGYEFL